MQLLVASGNAKKLAELQRILDARGLDSVELVSLKDVPAYPEPRETGRTFAENALIKARAGAAASGLPCVADDSGLVVDELQGMPGVLSARWGGSNASDQFNLELVLDQVKDAPDERRGAAFVSVCALVTPNGQETLSEGRWEGTLLRAPQGDGGFGYDPIFSPVEHPGKSSAELTPEHKDELSHRGKALAGLVPTIEALI
ncbi:RdgB/HAM1 family non-canonical purine NTP pyrophosphatase [Corynebacterium renale]|uniref:dITP/XTP pyrophosphatase n=1 Tax=Corynebacterium renale TaxID=1724 RepID=A0A2A9DMZ4_9CORY|nr:RdgB/HAM1 family non-canonical purine NTP pyrophosphatase [Corynebacterium renale]PFG28117.1 XTP/dITP diphosphohydrolase [Corynebacterium renale]SQI20495.1 dITP/XTP pyrophosphatase [Corynebacterium renale]